MTRVYQITPFLHVRDLEQAVDFFTRVLRFEVKFRMDTYAYLEWQKAALRILEEPPRPLPVPGEKVRMTIYVDVDDVDALYAELLPELNTLPAGDAHPPEDKPYGQREVHVRLPDGQWLAFGQPIQNQRT
jgi:catechol 2,3-dioxygenase-like lactoylglutathione lyase family enzyme